MHTSKIIRTFHDPHRRWTIHQGDVQSVFPTLSGSLYDASLCDPPYGIGFQENRWDSDVPPTSTWQQLLRTCKPGAYLLAFGGTKTFHRLFCYTEDAGWENRDTVCWLYGTGFPKGHDLSKAIDETLGIERPVVGAKPNRHRRKGKRNSHFNCAKTPGTIPLTVPASDSAKAWDGYSTALKPAWEPILLAQKPRRGTFANNALQYGCGGLNVSACRIGPSGSTNGSHQEPSPRINDDREHRTDWKRSGNRVKPITNGRWPANVMLDDEAAQELDRQSRRSSSIHGLRHRAGCNVANDHVNEGKCDESDSGVSRLFYVAKAGPKERKGNDHPTVKPLALCVHLARLILPPPRKTPRRLIVPFSGSGSEMLGALMAGWDHVTGIECDPQYVEIAKRRLSDFDMGTAMPE